MRLKILSLLLVIWAGVSISACAYWQAIAPILPDLAASLLSQLEAEVSTFETGALSEAATPELQLALTAVQAARRALIMELLECLTAEYPNIVVTPYLERINAATIVVPLRE